eukprot:CAMPEP_0182436590 /NCGR_PEP_ID=MMETSP1167-20130531/82366_1 /TAXON_ID=2988 /ORGANISM="Mallomonas Sp, Strain CCMP3275" /LENGTH=378 /DNA_ID=CAMNT_0024628917 /DNA_START=386 /DNA_END=1519 /DNA_ORIENTATION=-
MNKNTEQSFWISPAGLNIEVLYSPATKNPTDSENKAWYLGIYSQIVQLVTQQKQSKPKLKPPILFIHGSFHGAWCWAENFFTYFNDLGFDCFAHSLRGTSNTGLPPGDRVPSIRVESHLKDLLYVIKRIREEQPERPPPILIAHSFGGLYLMKLLEIPENRGNVSAAVFLCSVPPSGLSRMTLRFMQSSFMESLKIIWGFALKAATSDVGLCRRIFFDETVAQEDILRYMKNFLADSRVGLDVINLAPVLPSVRADPVTGQADWLEEISSERKEEDLDLDLSVTPSLSSELSSDTENSIDTEENITEKKNTFIPRLVVGAEKDFIVDAAGTQETATFLGVEPMFLADLPHDVMLVPRWREAAAVIADWLSSILSVNLD